MTEVLRLACGDEMVDVEVERVGKRLAFRAPFGLKEEFKCMRGARWDPEERRWEAQDCRRNWMQLEGLQKDPATGTFRIPRELERYHAPRLGVRPTRPEAQPHQASLLDFGASVRGCIWAAEQGVGKTLSAIELMEWASARGFTDWWYVCPKPVIKAVELELAKWKCKVRPRFVHLDVLERETEERFKCRSCGAEEPERHTWSKAKVVKGHACTAEMVEGKCPECGWYEGQRTEPGPRCRSCSSETEQHRALWRSLGLPPCPHGVIWDEASRLRNGGANWTRAAQRLSDRVRDEHDGFNIEMTGTPAPHDPCDWHSEAEIARPGLLRESTRPHLERRLAVYEKQDLGDGRCFNEIVGWRPDEVRFLYERLKPIVEIVMAKDVLTLPELIKEVIHLPVSEELERAARLVAQSSRSGAQALNRLRQLSDGFQYGGIHMCSDCEGVGGLDLETGDERRWVECHACSGAGFLRNDSGVREVPGPKDERLREDLALNEEVGRLVVYAGYHASVDRCVRTCREEGWQVLQCDGRGWRVVADHDRWTDIDLLKEMDLGTRTDLDKLALVGHPASVGLGQNLTAARENIFFSNDFNAESRMQAEKRSHRNGQTRAVRIKDYACLKTDELILRNLEVKRGWQNVTLGVSLEEVLACL